MATNTSYNKNRLNVKPLYNEFPASIRVWPDLLITAEQRSSGGAARLWMIAKHINPGGCGVIPTKALRNYAVKGLGIKRAKYDTWLDRADLIGLLSRHGEYIRITGIARAAALLGVDRIRRPVYLDIGALVRPGWFSQVWAAWLKVNGFTDQPISRAALRELSGVSERNQRELERRAAVVNRANYAIDANLPADNLAGIRDFNHPGAFRYKNVIAWRLPNSREVNQDVDIAAKGSTRRTNKRLASWLSDLSNSVGRASVRLYNQNDKQLDKTTNKIRRLGCKGADDLPDQVYLLDGPGHRFGMYAVIAV